MAPKITSFTNGRSICRTADGNAHIIYQSGTALYHRLNDDAGMKIAAPVTAYSVDANGNTLFVSYAAGGALFVTSSVDSGKTWSKSVCVSGSVQNCSATDVKIWTDNDTVHGVVTWGVAPTGTSEVGLYVAHYNGQWSTPHRIDTGSVEALFPSIDGTSDHLFAIWRDRRSGRYEIWCAEYVNGTWSPDRKLFTGMDPSLSITGHKIYIGYHTSNQSTYVASSGDGGKKWKRFRLDTTGYFANVHASGDTVAAVWADYTEHCTAQNNAKRRVGYQVSKDGGATWTAHRPFGEDVNRILASIWVSDRIDVCCTDATNGHILHAITS